MTENAPITKRNPGKYLFRCILLILGLWLASIILVAGSLLWRGWRLAQVANQPIHVNITALASEVRGARLEWTILRFETAPLWWVCKLIGNDASAIAYVLDAGDESLAAADLALSSVEPALGGMTLGSFTMSDMPKILDALVQARPALAQASRHLDTAQAALAQIRGPLSPEVERRVGQAKSAIDLARQGTSAAQIAPELLGRDGSRTYLILIQNSDELRPTGGYITTVGRVVLSQGKVITQTFEDVYGVDDFSKYYPDPPLPLQQYMLAEQWVFRDVNWSPDFPTTARDAMYLYQIAHPGQIDGVIGVNLKTLQMLMPAFEPLAVEGLPEPITSVNVLNLLRQSRDPQSSSSAQPNALEQYMNTHKQSIGPAIRAMMDKLFTGKLNWFSLVLGASNALNQRQITFFVQGKEQEQLKNLNWDGALRTVDGDYLMVVDANIGFTRANAIVREEINYQVTLDSTGKGQAITLVNYVHGGSMQGVMCKPYPAIEMVTYDTLINRCYYDYLRLYVPASSKLTNAIAHPVPASYLLSGKPSDGKVAVLPEEVPVPRTVFGQFFVVEHGKQLQARFEYALPNVVKNVDGKQQYSLLLQKQSGTDAIPVKITLTLPPQSQVISTTPLASSQAGTTLVFDLKLDVDRQIQVIYSSAR